MKDVLVPLDSLDGGVGDVQLVVRWTRAALRRNRSVLATFSPCTVHNNTVKPLDSGHVWDVLIQFCNGGLAFHYPKLKLQWNL